MEYQKVDLEVDGAGRSQTTDQRIARITGMFQSGLVHPDVAREAIKKLSRGVYVTEIETTRLAVKPLESVDIDPEIKARNIKTAHDAVEADAASAEAQGMAPRAIPSLEPEQP